MSEDGKTRSFFKVSVKFVGQEEKILLFKKGITDAKLLSEIKNCRVNRISGGRDLP